MIISDRIPDKHDPDIPPSESSPHFRFSIRVVGRPGWVPRSIPDHAVIVAGCQSFEEAEPEALDYFRAWIERRHGALYTFTIHHDAKITDSKAGRYLYRRPNGESWMTSAVRARVEQELCQMRAALEAVAAAPDPEVDALEPYDYIHECLTTLARLRSLAAAALNGESS